MKNMQRISHHVTIASCVSILVFLFLLCAGSSTAAAADLYVSATGEYDGQTAYTNLQEAVDAAATGDTLWVEDGFVCASGATTNANGASRIYVGKRLTLRSRSGTLDNPVIIRGAWHSDDARFGENAVRCLETRAGGTRIIGFRLEGGSVNTNLTGDARLAGGWLGTGVLSNCMVTGNSAVECGAMYSHITAQPLTAYTSLVSSNYARSSRGSHYAGSFYSTQFIGNSSDGSCGVFYYGTYSNCLFAGNSAKGGDGVGVLVGTAMYDCIVSNNTAGGECGGVSYTPRLYRCTFIGNRAMGGAGGAVRGGAASARAIAVDCLFQDNEASGSGGAAQHIVASGCRFDNNRSGGNGGGCDGGIFTNCFFGGNIVSNSGWGICNGGGVYGGTLTNCVLVANKAWNSNSTWPAHYGLGGGAAESKLHGCVVSNNFARFSGGGLGNSSGADNIVVFNTSGYQGGGLMRGTHARTLVAHNTNLSSSGVTAGGGASLVTATDCTFSNNFSLGTAGGVNECTLTDCQVVCNTASNGTGSAWGAGSIGGASKGRLVRCLIAGNMATSDAGNTSLGHGGTGGTSGSTLIECVVSNNTAQQRTGGVSGGTGYNNLVINNYSGADGGGIFGGTHYNTLVVGNVARRGVAGVAWGTVLYNCTVTGNTSQNNSNGGLNTERVTSTISWGNVGAKDSLTYATNSCSSAVKDTHGPGNTAANPKLGTVGRLQYVPMPGSPCLNAGVYQPWMTDMADVRSHDRHGRRRIIGSAVDMGAFEAPTWGTVLLAR